VGSNKPSMEDAPLPANLPDERDKTSRRREPKARSPRQVDQEAAREAALAYAREERKRDAVRRKEEAAREKTRKRREQAVEKAQAALDKARHQHARKAGAIAAERAKIEARAEAEEERWQKQKSKLERALHRARS